jgi:hypothetical protein
MKEREHKILFDELVKKPIKKVGELLKEIHTYFYTLFFCLFNPNKVFENEVDNTKILSPSKFSLLTIEVNFLLISLIFFFKKTTTPEVDYKLMTEIMFIFWYILSLIIITVVSWIWDFVESRKEDNFDIFFKSVIYLFNTLYFFISILNLFNASFEHKLNVISISMLLFQLYFLRRINAHFVFSKGRKAFFYAMIVLVVTVLIFINAGMYNVMN